MAEELNKLGESLHEILAGKVVSLDNKLGELTLVVHATDILDVFTRLRDHAKFRFTQLIDLCGVDYSTYGGDIADGGVYLADDVTAFKNRFAVVYHLLSIEHNQRLRVKTFATDDEMPVLDS